MIYAATVSTICGPHNERSKICVAVTGAQGFIGRHLTRELEKDPDITLHKYASSHGDVAQKATWRQIPACDVLIHLAGKASVPLSWKATDEFIHVNCLGIQNAIDYCIEHSAKLVFLSSYLYAGSEKGPVVESSALAASNPYTLTKLFAEQLIEIFSVKFPFEFRILRPFNVYGPCQSSGFLIPKIIHAAKGSGHIFVDNLDARRDYVYVDDLVDAIVKVLHYEGTERIFNIGTGVGYSAKEVIDQVQALMKRPLRTHPSDNQRSGEVLNSVADITLAKRELGWVPKFDLLQGLHKTIYGL